MRKLICSSDSESEEINKIQQKQKKIKTNHNNEINVLSNNQYNVKIENQLYQQDQQDQQKAVQTNKNLNIINKSQLPVVKNDSNNSKDKKQKKSNNKTQKNQKNYEEKNEIFFEQQDMFDSLLLKQEEINTQSIQQQEYLYSQLQNEIAQKCGQLQKQYERISEFTLITVKCLQGHIWETNFNIIKRGFWCEHCDLKLQQIQKYANSHQGQLLAICLQQKLQFECRRKHRFELNFKDYQRKWCDECYQIFTKQYLEDNIVYNQQFEDEIKIIKESANSQAKIYIRSYLKNQQTNSSQTLLQQQSNNNIIDTQKEFQKQEEEHKDKKLKNGQSDDEFIKKIQLVYFIINIAENQYLQYLKQMSQQELDDEKLNCYRILHPDKNKHPLAREAFNKAKEIIDQIIEIKEKQEKSE